MNRQVEMLLPTGLLAAAALFSQTTQAADNGIYLGAGVVRSSIDPITTANTANLDDNDNGFKAIAGVRPLDWFAVEANYIDFGKISLANTVSNSKLELKGVDAFAVFLIDIKTIDLYAKVGGIRWQSDASSSVLINNVRSTFEDSDSGFDVAYGVGVQARFGSIAARLEYEQFKVEETDKVSALTLGVTWTFL